ncbi:MAG: hypothetical protein DMD94_19185 [Candidatus Rokuibacteriota bacterium]|nr:MAG: hypothetical protein DMD94_19185 [Candidatus Rokubacteria bacterium]
MSDACACTLCARTFSLLGRRRFAGPRDARAHPLETLLVRGRDGGRRTSSQISRPWHGSWSILGAHPRGGGRMSVWRSWFPGFVVAIVLMTMVAADASHLKENARKHRVVYQLDDAGLDKAKFVLGNIRNHVAGVGGWQNVESLELVVFGPALKSFVQGSMDPALKQTLETLQGQGMTFGACGNTMKNFSITTEQLPAKSLVLPQGGVVRIMELQELGYIYLRP